ncbi:MAG: T9SS type A sorting domain-containing protein, partial [Candidatus Kapaibacterium sp.]
FTAMGRNVTPVYTINVFTPIDENTANNMTMKPVRFYLMRSPVRMMNSVVNVTSDPNSSTTPWSEVVGRLNTDSLFRALGYLGLNSTSYDVFDRNGWEPRAVNYTNYRSLFWAEDTARFTRQQRTDVRTFLANGIASDKKNFVLASQEILGKHIGLDATNDEQFVRNVLRATNANTGALKGATPTDRTPRAAGYDNQQVLGVTLAQGIREIVAKTTNVNDPMVPMPSLMRIFSDNQTNGLARAAYSYPSRDAGVTDSIMGIATNALNYNVVFLGVDWRHLPRTTVNQGSERIMRAIIEFIERSQGVVVPVELVAFDAQRSGSDVRVAWETASEKNSSHFDVERAAVTMAGKGSFTTVRTVAAQGTSTTSKDYMVVDANVSQASAWSYRLKMVDLDGSSRYSQEVLVASETAPSTLTVAPNPASTTTNVTVELVGSGMTEVTLVDMNGRTVATIAQADLSGKQHFTLNTDAFASGSYTVVVKQNGSITSQSLQIVK